MATTTAEHVEIEVSEKAYKTASKYQYEIYYSTEDERYIGEALELEIHADGETPVEALQEIMEVAAASVQLMIDDGNDIVEPFNERSYSGIFNVRTTPTRHRELVIEAAKEGVSLNQLANLKLSK